IGILERSSAHPKEGPMIQARKSNPVPILADVAAFAAEQGVSNELPAVIEMTQRIFPDATLGIEVEEDPEIADERHILVNADEVNLSGTEALDKTWQWHRELFACCPAPLAPVFRMTLRGLR